LVKGADAAAEGQLENDHEEKISRLTSTMKKKLNQELHHQ